MATYKVIQDIEAEDKLVGPLSLRQFLYAIGAAAAGYLCFLSISKHAPFLLVVFAPLFLLSGFFAFPWKGEQTTEVWALAHLRFYIMPHVRIWNQSGARDYVTVLARAKRRQAYAGNGMSQDEVHSRLKALADTIDSHGWAVKGATAEDLSQTDPLLSHTTSDRLVGVHEAPLGAASHMRVQEHIPDHEDILDDSNAVSQKFDTMMSQDADDRRKRLMAEVREEAAKPVAPPVPVQAPAQPATATTKPQPAGTQITSQDSASGQPTGKWFVNAPGVPGGTTNITIIAPGTPQVSTANTEPTEAEKQLAEQFKAQNETQQPYYQHMHVVQPPGAAGQAASAPATAATPEPDRAATAPAAGASKPGGSLWSTPLVVPAKAAKKPVLAEAPKPEETAKAPVTAEQDAAILEYANNDDLDVATIARQMNRQSHKSPSEIEIRLH